MGVWHSEYGQASEQQLLNVLHAFYAHVYGPDRMSDAPPDCESVLCLVQGQVGEEELDGRWKPKPRMASSTS